MVQARAAEAAAPADGSLELHEGIARVLGCDRWPKGLRLRNETTGELVLGRCRSTNQCRYCQRLYVLETVEMLVLDALEWAPVAWSVLTAREHLTRAEFNGHLRRVRDRLRLRWPEWEYFVQVEFQRRGALHGNLLHKGIPEGRFPEFQAQLVEFWCERVDALPVSQWGEPIDGRGAEGVVKYLSKMLAHGLKAEQAPPLGWKGHRTSQSRGYLVQSAAAMRRRAREALQVKRELWKAVQAGHDAHDAELIARQALELAGGSAWVLATDRGARVGAIQRDAARMALPKDSGRTVKPLPARMAALRAAAEPLVLFKLHDGALAVCGAQHSGLVDARGLAVTGESAREDGQRGRATERSRSAPAARPPRSPASLAVSPADP